MDFFNWEQAKCPLSGIKKVPSWEFLIHYHYSNFNRCHSRCPLYRGCLVVGGSVIGGSTVVAYGVFNAS